MADLVVLGKFSDEEIEFARDLLWCDGPLDAVHMDLLPDISRYILRAMRAKGAVMTRRRVSGRMEPVLMSRKHSHSWLSLRWLYHEHFHMGEPERDRVAA